MLQDPGINCPLGDAGSAGWCCWDGPTSRGAALGMGSRGNEQNQLCALGEFGERQNWFLTSKLTWGAEYCRILWESQSQSLSLKCTADLAETTARYQRGSYFSQLWLVG